MWRLIHRKEFEHNLQIENIRQGQVLRFSKTNSVLEITGFVMNVSELFVFLTVLTGENYDTDIKVNKYHMTNVVEICSCPLFYRFKSTMSGNQHKHPPPSPFFSFSFSFAFSVLP